MASKEIIANVFKPVCVDIESERHDEYWLKGGRGSGKSTFCGFMIVIGMLQDKHANAIIYRRIASTLKDSVYAQIVAVIDMLGLNDEFRYKINPLEIIYKRTGQRILFRGADDPKKSKSIKLTRGYFKYLWFEELSEFKGMEDIRTIKQSIFRGVNYACTLYSYNPPKTAQSWVNIESLNAAPNRYVHSSTYLDIAYDHPEWLGEAFIKDATVLASTNERAYRNEYLGEVTGNGGNIFENVEVRDITQEELDTIGSFYQGVDWGWFPDPFQWVRCGWNANKRIMYIIDEARANKMGNRETYDLVGERLRKDEPLTADSAEPKSVADWREYGAWWVRGAVKGAGSVDYSIKWLGALTKIVIDTKCKWSAKEFTTYEYEKNAQGEYVHGYADRDNHCLSADTLVDTVDGQVKIAELVGKTGYVHCYDEQNGRATTAAFYDVRQTGVEEIFEIELEDGRIIRASGEHPILTQRGWVIASELDDSDSVLQL